MRSFIAVLGVFFALFFLGVGGPPMSFAGELKGHQVQPRELAQYDYEAGFTDARDLVVAVAVELSESQGFDHAINTNPNGTADRGVWQLNTIHPDYTDEIAYDPAKASRAAFALYSSRKRAGQTGFEDWYGYLNGIYLHDSYIGRAVVGVANFLGDQLLKRPVPFKVDGTPYVHGFTTPMASYQFRVVQGLIANQRAAKVLGFGAKSAAVVLAAQKELAPGRTVVKKTIP